MSSDFIRYLTAQVLEQSINVDFKMPHEHVYYELGFHMAREEMLAYWIENEMDNGKKEV